MPRDEIIWFTNPGLVKYPFKQFEEWLKKRKTVDVTVKIGSLKILSFRPEDNFIRFTRPIIRNRIKAKEDPLGEIAIEWKIVIDQFLSLITLDLKFYKKLKKMNEFLLLKTILSTFQKHQTNKRVIIRLIKIPRNNYWTIRAIVGHKFHELKDLTVAARIKQYLKDQKKVWEPHEILVTKSKTRIRIIFPKTTFQLESKYTITFGIDVINSEMGRGALNVEKIILFNDINVIARIPIISSNSQMSHLIKNNDDKLDSMIDLINIAFTDFKKLEAKLFRAISIEMTSNKFEKMMESARIQKNLRKKILEHWNAEKYLFSFIYAVLSSAKGRKDNFKVILQFERYAGKLLNEIQE